MPLSSARPTKSLDYVSALSVDVFETLIDLGAVKPAVVREVCALAGTRPRPELWDRVSDDIGRQFRSMERSGAKGSPGSAGQAFTNVAGLFEQAYAVVLPSLGLSGAHAAEAARVLLNYHAQAPAYRDARHFLEGAARAMPVCVASDADRANLDECLEQSGLAPFLPLRVCSEQVGGYKAQPDGRLFQAVLAALGRLPEEVAHVGDSQSDVVGARRAGLVSVWLNRHGRRWPREDVYPDLVVRSLDELSELLAERGLAAG